MTVSCVGIGGVSDAVSGFVSENIHPTMMPVARLTDIPKTVDVRMVSLLVGVGAIVIVFIFVRRRKPPLAAAFAAFSASSLIDGR